MPDSENEDKPGIKETTLDFRKLSIEQDLNNPVTIVERVYQIWWHWADFHLYISSPHIERISPPIIIEPESLSDSDNELEFVYSIHDSGNKLSASKSEDMMSAGMSMCKLFFTIEKMINILISRLKSGGISTETEVQVAFGGHEIAQRKAFESIINLSYNVVVTNFEPGEWGERYLENVKRMASKYGYPPEAPRETYKHSYNSNSAGIKR
ncbi:virulence factor [Legionella antarctica]|uniref:Virulence factor n=1 Tax=Legionella antarctica TaxID=2708020 RepID=A0A6F8T948_9GAMM|nr:virulence factor [Legionella antarctica]BCA96753.1 virulence factor [Legionella antarctica]